jgi:hypothetical protein
MCITSRDVTLLPSGDATCIKPIFNPWHLLLFVHVT